MNQEIQNILNHAKRMGATHYIEVYMRKGQLEPNVACVLPVEKLRGQLVFTNVSMDDLRTSHVFLIKAKKSEAQKV